mmetsp:Transcript_59979/g.140119  ORF Transcript_59979/g.140119 Transcript_59979/m.140119 type:complete len:214 (-) Transcript_59979:16-657(-)
MPLELLRLLEAPPERFLRVVKDGGRDLLFSGLLPNVGLRGPLASLLQGLLRSCHVINLELPGSHVLGLLVRNGLRIGLPRGGHRELRLCLWRCFGCRLRWLLWPCVGPAGSSSLCILLSLRCFEEGPRGSEGLIHVLRIWSAHQSRDPSLVSVQPAGQSLNLRPDEVIELPPQLLKFASHVPLLCHNGVLFSQQFLDTHACRLSSAYLYSVSA